MFAPTWRKAEENGLARHDRAQRALSAAARDRKLKITRAGRFFHLTGGSDKGRAARVLMGLFEAAGRRLSSIGLGDAPNDLTMLAAVQQPIVIPRPDRTADPALAEALPGAQVAPRPGPRRMEPCRAVGPPGRVVAPGRRLDVEALKGVTTPAHLSPIGAARRKGPTEYDLGDAGAHGYGL